MSAQSVQDTFFYKKLRTGVSPPVSDFFPFRSLWPTSLFCQLFASFALYSKKVLFSYKRASCEKTCIPTEYHIMPILTTFIPLNSIFLHILLHIFKNSFIITIFILTFVCEFHIYHWRASISLYYRNFLEWRSYAYFITIFFSIWALYHIHIDILISSSLIWKKSFL